MRDFTVLSAALEIIEKRLCDPMNAATLAQECFSSYSGLQKLFGYAFGYSVSEYITKRRLSRASMELITGKKSITEIALDYQYNSPEAFTRAFRRFWGITPREFRNTRRFHELQPRLIIEEKKGGTNMSTRKPVDVSSLYDELRKLSGSYTLGLDIANFDRVNNDYGYAIGDIVIAEAFARIESELDSSMFMFRTGADEFAVVTSYKAIADAEALGKRIAAKNGEPVKTGEYEIPLTLYVAISRVPEKVLDYQEALAILYEAIDEAKKSDDSVFVFTEE